MPPIFHIKQSFPCCRNFKLSEIIFQIVYYSSKMHLKKKCDIFMLHWKLHLSFWCCPPLIKWLAETTQPSFSWPTLWISSVKKTLHLSQLQWGGFFAVLAKSKKPSTWRNFMLLLNLFLLFAKFSYIFEMLILSRQIQLPFFALPVLRIYRQGW